MSLFLIPTPIGTSAFHAGQLPDIKHFIVENAKEARRSLKKIMPEIVPGDLQMIEQDKHRDNSEEIKAWMQERKKNNEHFGLLSDAGVPCVADPGARIVAFAHRLKIPVVPVVGPSSILLALMASGFNGQSFAFHGYLPVNEKEQIKKIRMLEEESQKRNMTQLFIETPYRNNKLLETLTRTLHPFTRISVACDLLSPSQQIISQTAEEWKKQKTDFHKRPAVFLLYSGTEKYHP
jgi:16S rRNA (cytidine1402-2'-O)-methyltransferase